MKLTAKLEKLDHLTRDNQTAVRMIAASIESQATSFESARAWLRELGMFIYSGGSHLSLHAADGDSRRIMLVTEARG